MIGGDPRGSIGDAGMTPRLAGRLEYNAATIAALAKWMQNGEKKPRRTFAKKTVPRPKRLL